MEAKEASNASKSMSVYVTKCVNGKIIAVQETTLEDLGIKL